MWREKLNRKISYLTGRIFKRQKIPEGEIQTVDTSITDISAIIPIAVIQPIVVPERFKVEIDENEGKVEKESIAMRFSVDTGDLDKGNNILNKHK